MSLVEENDINEFVRFILSTEKMVYKENPFPIAKDTMKKEREYQKKVEEITAKIAQREGISYENKKN